MPRPAPPGPRRPLATFVPNTHAKSRIFSPAGGYVRRPRSALTSPIRSPIIGSTARGTRSLIGTMPPLWRRRMVKLTGKKFVSGALLAAGIAGFAIGQAVLQNKAEAQGASVQAPRFVVDPLWPKPLPNNWLLGWTIGVW